MLAVVAADALSCVFLFFKGHLYRHFSLKAFNLGLLRSMFRYSVPLIPTQIFWWVINVSSRFFITGYHGANANGIYAAAYKLPTILTVFSNIFVEAWQLSAIAEKDTADKREFYTGVFHTMQGVCFAAGAGLIILSKQIMYFWVDEDFFTAWLYVPMLVVATTFSCFVSFLGSLYMVEKRSKATFATMLAGAIVNFALNMVLIPDYGLFGAATATVACFVTVFVIRLIHTKHQMYCSKFIAKLIVNTVLTVALAVLVTLETGIYIYFAWAIALILIGINLKDLLALLKKLILKQG